MTGSRLLTGHHCLGLSSVLLTACTTLESTTLMGRGMETWISDFCYWEDRGQWAWPTGGDKRLWRSCAEQWVSYMFHPGASETAEFSSCQLLQYILLIRPSAPPESTERSNWIKTIQILTSDIVEKAADLFSLTSSFFFLPLMDFSFVIDWLYFEV